MKRDKEFLEEVSIEKQKNAKKEIIELIRNRRLRLGNLGEELRADKEIVLEAIRKENGYDEASLRYASEELKADKEVVLEAVRNNGNALQFASEELQADKDVQKVLSAKKLEKEKTKQKLIEEIKVKKNIIEGQEEQINDLKSQKQQK